MISLNNSQINTKVPCSTVIEEVPNVSAFLTLLSDLRACYASKLESDDALFDETAVSYQVSNLGKRLEDLLSRLPSHGHSRDLMTTLRSKIMSLWNDTVQLKIRTGIKGNSKSVLLIRSIAMSLFVALSESESEVEFFMTLVTMAHKVCDCPMIYLKCFVCDMLICIVKNILINLLVILDLSMRYKYPLTGSLELILR